ncbi:MAG: hypothetical protein IPG50_07005 [Myxococcales bacterium]|jgi:hypothetical protein|nr:hypothetical protein [Myxococcales bacterium]
MKTTTSQLETLDLDTLASVQGGIDGPGFPSTDYPSPFGSARTVGELLGELGYVGNCDYIPPQFR